MATSELPAGGFRKLWPSEGVVFREHLQRLDAESLRNRFAMSVGEDFLADYAARCFTFGTIVYGFFDAGVLRAAAELRPLSVIGDGNGEIAFSVEHDWRNKGIGSELFGRLITAARNRGFRRLHMNCLAWNRPMQALARKFDADLQFETGDIVGTIVADTRNPASFLREAIDDVFAFTTAVVDLQSRQFGRWNRITAPR